MPPLATVKNDQSNYETIDTCLIAAVARNSLAAVEEFQLKLERSIFGSRGETFADIESLYNVCSDDYRGRSSGAGSRFTNVKKGHVVLQPFPRYISVFLEMKSLLIA